MCDLAQQLQQLVDTADTCRHHDLKEECDFACYLKDCHLIYTSQIRALLEPNGSAPAEDPPTPS